MNDANKMLLEQMVRDMETIKATTQHTDAVVSETQTLLVEPDWTPNLPTLPPPPPEVQKTVGWIYMKKVPSATPDTMPPCPVEVWWWNGFFWLTVPWPKTAGGATINKWQIRDGKVWYRVGSSGAYDKEVTGILFAGWDPVPAS